jgi:hypothetical protein
VVAATAVAASAGWLRVPTLPLPVVAGLLVAFLLREPTATIARTR